MLPTEISQTRVAPRGLLYQLTFVQIQSKSILPFPPLHSYGAFSLVYISSPLLLHPFLRATHDTFISVWLYEVPDSSPGGHTQRWNHGRGGKEKKSLFSFTLACLSDITPPGFGSLILPAALTKRSVHIKRPGILLRIGCSSPSTKAQVWSVQTMCRPRRAINTGPGMH